jgi:hypothetical protein
MERMNRAAIFLIGLIGAASMGAVEPTSQPAGNSVAAAPTTQPAFTRSTDTDFGRRERSSRRGRNRGESSGMLVSTDPYAVLRSRSIFVKGDQTITSDSSPGRSNTDSGGLSGHPGSALVFNGVIMVGDQANAMIEDTGSNQVSLVKAGDPIAAGKVSAITFDDLTYEVNGQEKHVSLGQNMDGVVPATVAAAAPTTMPGGGSPPTDGSGASAGASGPPSSGSGASPEEILARMRAKRNQELGIKP